MRKHSALRLASMAALLAVVSSAMAQFKVPSVSSVKSQVNTTATKVEEVAEDAVEEVKEKAGIVRQKVASGKLPSPKDLGIPSSIKLPPLPSGKAKISFRANSTISAADLARKYAVLEKKASPAVKAEAERLREKAKKKGYKFKVGVTAVSGTSVASNPGAQEPPKPTPAERQAMKEQDAQRKQNEKEQAARHPKPKKKAKAGRMTGKKGEKLVQAPYHVVTAGSRAAASWMDPAAYPLPNSCSSSGSKWISRDALPPVRDQQCGNCWSYSSIAALEINQAYLNGSFYDYSEQSMVDCAETWSGMDAGSCNGGRPERVFDFMRRSGPALESDVPTGGRDSVCQASKLSQYRGVDYGPADLTSNYYGDVHKKDMIKASICEHGSVSTLINATPLFEHYQGGAPFNEPDASTRINHAINIVGWDDSKNAWLVRNSWSTGWGDGGYAWVDYETNGIGKGTYWVKAGPGDGGTREEGSVEGFYFTREPVIKNSTSETLNARVQYIGWTGSDGLMWLPQADGWLNFAIPAGAEVSLGSPFIGRLRATKMRIIATGATSGKVWNKNELVPIDLVPDRGYWGEIPGQFTLEVTSKKIVARTKIANPNVVTSGTCHKWALERVVYQGNPAYAWDDSSAPDFDFFLKVGTDTISSSVKSDLFNAYWGFDITNSINVDAGQEVTLKMVDDDGSTSEVSEEITFSLPTKAKKKKNYKMDRDWAKGHANWVCIQ